MSTRRASSSAVVVFVLVLGNVLLCATAYWAWQGRQVAERARDVALSERNQAKESDRKQAEQMRVLRQRINHLSELEFGELLDAIDSDLEQFGGGLPQETYSDLVRRLHTLGESLKVELKQVAADKDRLQRDFEVAQSARQAAVQTAEADSREARQELLSEQAEFNLKLAGKNDEIARILDRANTLASRLETEKRDRERVREELLGQVDRLRKILLEARAPHTPNALAKQTPDGKVIRASAATKTAWLNIGSKDGVEPQLTFSVQPAGFTGNPFTKPKAKLEVIKVNGLDLCEASILESSITNPVLEGDLIYNPVWNPGKVMRFALAGLFDLDGDGSDDRSKIRLIIQKAGAKIDAELLPDGTEQGELSVETNYFIRGRHPDPEKAGVVQLRVLSAMANMERTALDYGAVVIELDKFLDLMGYSATRPPSSGVISVGTPGATRGATPRGR